MQTAEIILASAWPKGMNDDDDLSNIFTASKNSFPLPFDLLSLWSKGAKVEKQTC